MSSPQSGQLKESPCFSLFLYEFRSLQWPERSCDRVARCRLVRYVSSSLIGGGRLFNSLLSVMLCITVLTNKVCIAWRN